MPNDEAFLKVSSELSPLGKKPKRPFSIKKVLRFAWKFLVMLVFALLMGANAQIVYDYTRYEKFYVNGESMYPTLNRNVTVYDTDGNDVTDTRYPPNRLGDFVSPGSYTCDYGLMDTAKQAIDSVSRFDIVVTYFPSDMTYDETNKTYTPKANAALKIKRVIGLPNEKIKFDENGDLFVYDGEQGDYSLLEQPFLEAQEDWDETLITWMESAKKGTIYSNSSRTTLVPHPFYELQDEEYFVVGDNRQPLGSKDSREVGAIPQYCVVGKVKAIIAKCLYTINKDGSSSQKLLWNSVLMPWDIRYL